MSDLSRINTLGTYNAERSHGIVHTPEWVAFMEQEQRWFDEEYMSATWKAMGYEPAPDAGPLTVYRKIKRDPFWKRWLAL